MEDDECAKMLDHLQQYVPHLEKLIAQLKDPKRRNRELQLNKLEGLHSMITDRKKKLKLDTLRKCEDVILKILHKVHPNIYKQLQLRPETQLDTMVKFVCKNPPEEKNKVLLGEQSDILNAIRFKQARARLNEVAATPASPSPPRDIPLAHAPIVIPTEKVKVFPDPDEFQIKNWENTFNVRNRLGGKSAEGYKTEKPDVYRKAAESLTSNNSKKLVFERLGTKVDMSKPPLSAEDLQQLTDPEREILLDESQELSMGELEDLREVLQKKLQQSDDKKKVKDLRSKLTRDNPNKVKEKDKEKEKKSQTVVKPVPPPVSKPKSPRIEKVYKNPDSIFGSLLSSIDEQILGDTVVKKKDKKDDKHSKSDHKSKDSSKKDHHSVDKKDHHSVDKKDKDMKSNMKSHKDDKREHRHKDKHGSNSKDKERSRHKSRSSSKDKESDRHKSSSSDKHKSKHHEKKREEKSDKSIKQHDESLERKAETKTETVTKDDKSRKTDESTENKEAPVYKRLADKYNPRPRKSSIESYDKKAVESEIIQRIIPPKNDDLPSRIPSCEMSRVNHRQNMGNPWHGQESPIFEPPPKDKPNMFGGLVQSNNQNQRLLNIIPPLQGNPTMKTPLLQSPTGPNVPINYPVNNQMPCQNDMMTRNQFIPPQQNLLKQNMAPNRGGGGNMYMNTFILHNNVSSNIPLAQFKNAINAPFHNQISPQPKVFHPYDPIDSSSEYDLSKMQPVDFYTPQYNQTKAPLISPPNYANRGQYNSPFPQRDRSQYVVRPKVDSSWGPYDRNPPREREEMFRQVASRDPRIRAREMKERMNHSNKEAQQMQMRRKSVDENPQSRYDSMYSNVERGKVKEETFVSPLDSLYTTGETSQHTGKGYGIQKFRIPKRKADFDDRHVEEKDVKKDEVKKEAAKDDEDVTAAKEEPTVEKDEPVPSEASTSAVDDKKITEEKDSKASPTEQSIIADFITNLIQNSKKQELLSVILTSLTGNISDQQKKKFKRIQKIVDSDTDEETEDKPEKKSDDAKTETKTEEETQKKSEESAPESKDKTNEKVTKTDEPEEVADKVEEKEEEKTEEDVEEEEEEEEEEAEVEVAKTSPKTLAKKRKRRPIKKTKKGKAVVANKTKAGPKSKKGSPPVIEKPEDNVVETVGERIKNRRRNVKTPEVPKKKCRTELDMLHEDIKEMFIRDGVLTATGKRMCRILKSDSEPSLEAGGAKNLNNELASSVEAEMLDSPKRRARTSNPKVIIEKTDLSKLVVPRPTEESDSDNESLETTRLRVTTRGQLNKRKGLDSESVTSDSSGLSPIKRSASRRSKPKPNYIEDTDEDLAPHVSEPEPEPDEEDEGEETKKQDENTDDSPQKETPPKKPIPKKKKRGNNWAQGVIKKVPKKRLNSNSTTPTPSIDGDRDSELGDNTEEAMQQVQDDHDSDTELVEPDKNYYFDPQEKAGCKLCPFKGKMIVQHYKTNHSNHEVLISRIPPDDSKKAIEQSTEEGYEDIEVTDTWEAKNRRKKFTYQCRFCQVFFKNENSENFFDHLTGHTGEYRFICNFCTFKTANSKSLRSHLHCTHSATVEQTGSITPAYSAPPNFYMVFGYICGECNFIQMDRASVEMHVKIYHLGDDKQIYKINMSTVVCKPTQVYESNENEQTVETKTDDKVEEDANKTDEKAEVEQKAEEPVKSTIPSEKEHVSDKSKPNKDDPTVFKYNEAYTQENIKLDEQKHEKMKDINQTIIPKKKFTFNLLDKIKSRLDDKTVESIATEDDEMDDSSVQADNTVDVNMESVAKDVAAEHVDPKIVNPATKAIESNTEKPITNKTSVPISNIIERLQGKLNVEPPPLIPLNEFNISKTEPKSEDIIIQVGPVAARKKNEYILYICYMQSCMFSSTIQSEFGVHCRNFHGNKQWDGLCNICNANTGATEVEDAFIHLLGVHKNELGGCIAIKEELTETQSQVKSYLRMRRLSGDKLSEMRFEDNSNPGVSAIDEPFSKITSDESQESEVVEDSHSFPFHISNVTTLTPEEDQALNTPEVAPMTTALSTTLPTLTVINNVAGAGSVTTVTTPTTTPITIPLSLSNAAGTAYSLVLPVPMLTPTSKQSPTKSFPPLLVAVKPSLPSPTLKTPSPTKGQRAKPLPKKIMLKDTPLQPRELAIPRKTAYARSCLLTEQKLMQLYKCPERKCTYSTDSKKQFETHLHEHTDLVSGMQVPCLYCNFKTDLDYIGVHYDIRHGKCQFCCVYCFYRGLNQSYVEMHQEREHSKSPRRVLMVPVNPDTLTSQAQIALPALKSVIPYYVCGQLGCQSKFVFPDDFTDHLRVAHTGPLLCYNCQLFSTNIPENMIRHMQSHNVCYYHCRFCLLGATSMDEIYKHMSLIHFAMASKIVIRHFLPDKSGKSSQSYDSEDPELFERMKTISVEYYKYVTPTARFEVVPAYEVNKKPGLTSVKKTYAVPTPKTGRQARNEALTLYKTKKPNIVLKIVEQTSTDQKTNSNSDDIEIVQLSDDETSLTIKEGTCKQASPKTYAKDVRSQSPIVLNKFLGPPTNLLMLTQAAATTGLGTVNDIVKKATVKPIESVKEKDAIVLQPEGDMSQDEPLVDVTVERMEKSSTEDVDPLQLDLEACSTIPEQTNTDTNTEHTFTEAKLDVMANYSFSEDSDVQEFSDLTAEEVSFSVENSTKKQGLTGRDLFRCGFCRAGFEGAQQFRAHVTKCVEVNKIGNPKPFKCCHCVKAFKSCNSLLDHVRLHGTLRFSCSLCDFKHQHQLHIRSHMKNRHNVTNVTITPVDPNKRNYDEDEFVVRPKINRQKSTDSSSGGRDVNANSATDETNRPTKMSYGPDEIASLPLRPIFSQEVKCSDCGYLTKVRANLVRHFQFHITRKEVPVPAIAPVNPVPCLEKNEKMFDKMTNLALSSFNDIARMASKVEKKEKPGLSKEEEAQLPGFVPSNKRYVCGASYCDYLCLEESMLRYHLLALHSDESLYKCTHCWEKLSSDKGVINVDNIIKHLRLHDLHLYKCSYCKFLHNLKHKVDRHVLDKHADKPPIVIIVREMDHEPEEPPPEHEEIKETKPWRCGMCKYRCITKNEIVAHVFNKHDMESQHKCALCKFKSNTKSAFAAHFEAAHPGQSIDVIDAYYEVEETNTNSKHIPEGMIFDTTPLWQRDKNKFKHIRGIPVDETNKVPKKSPMKTANSFDNLDKAIEAVASGGLQLVEKDAGAGLKPKKPKTLKEKKMEINKRDESSDVIEIDDDIIIDVVGYNDEKADQLIVKNSDENATDDSIADVDRRNVLRISSSSRKDQEATKLSLQEIQKLDLDKLRNCELSGTYGPFGRPFNKQYLCPLCGIFKTKKTEDITHHLYKELHYPRFVCTNCAMTGITYNFLQKHSVKKHVDLPEAIHPMSPDPKIEDWVQKVLAVQGRLIVDNENVPTVSSTTTKGETKNKNPFATLLSPKTPRGTEVELKERQSGNIDNSKITVEEASTPDSSSTFDMESPGSRGKLIHQCQHCNYSCKAASDLRKHEKRHWVQKPLKCGYCDVEGVTNYEVIQHSKRAHAGMEPLVIAVPTPSTPTIKPITRKRKYPKNHLEVSSSGEEPPAKISALEITEINEESTASEEADIEVEDSIIVCNYCPKRCDTETDMKVHWEFIHKSKQPTFKFKKLTRTQLVKKGSITYKCCYCDRVGNMEVMKKHFKTEHQGLTFAVFRYKCPHCDHYFKSIDKVKAHCKNVHDDANPASTDIEESEEPKDYVCEYCDREFDVRQELIDHHKTMHSHLELNLPPNLLIQTTPQKEEDEKKKFMCPQCQHKSNSYAAMRDHVRAHAKPFQCFYCPQRFTYPSFVKHHHVKEHPNAEYKHKAIQEGFEMNENLRKNLLVLQEDGSYEKISSKNAKRMKSDAAIQPQKVRIVESTYKFDEEPSVAGKITARKSTTQLIPCKSKVVKVTARKSTTQLIMPSVCNGGAAFSYYGNEPDLDGIENVKTSLSFHGSMVSVNILQLKSILDIFPTVPLVDIVKHKTEL